MFGIDSSRSHSSSVSNSYGYSGSSSDSLSRGSSQSDQRLAFEDIFANLYSNAIGAAGRAATMAPGLTEQANMLFGSGTGFLEELGGPSAIDARLADTGTADEQVGALGEDLSRFLSEGLLPQLTSRGVAAGTLGGGREGVERGLAAESVAREFARGSTAIRTGDVARRDQLATSSAQQRLGAAGVGLNALPGMYDVAQAGVLSELAPWQALSGVLGGPTVLGSSSSEDIAMAIARSFAEDFSSSSSSSKSKAAGIKIG